MSSEQFTKLQQFFHALTLADYPRPTVTVDGDKVSTVIECTSDMRLRDVVTLLLAHNISSCPVRRVEYKDKSAPWEEAYLGVVDLLDIVAFVLAIMKTTAKWGKGFEAVLEAVVQFAEHTVQEVIDASPIVAFQSVSTTTDLAETLKLLGKDRFHRVIVTDEKEHMQNIITQSSMLNYLSSKIQTNDVFKNFCEQSIADLGLAKQQNIVCIPVSHKAVDAFHLIQKHRVTGVPIVDKNNNLVGNVSARDIRSMVGSPDKFDRLFDTIAEFLIDIQQDKAQASRPTTPSRSGNRGVVGGSPFAKAGKPVAAVAPAPIHYNYSAITVTAHDSLAYVISLLVQHRIHRVYIVKRSVNADGETIKTPIGVVTLTDIMHVFADGNLKNCTERIDEGANTSYSTQ